MRDQTLSLLRSGYPWAPSVRRGATAAPTRLLGRPAVVVGGPAGVRRFYDPRLQRAGAVPAPVRLVLFGPGAVHGLDDAAHHARKRLYVDLLTPDCVAELATRSQAEWERRIADWAPGERVRLQDEAVRVLGTSVLLWAGVPGTPEQLAARARRLAAVVDGFATPGRPWARAALTRVALDRWAAGLVAEVRAGRLPVPDGSALDCFAAARELPARVAGVELLNVVRPTVATSWFVTAAGKALGEHPEWRRRAADDRAVAAAVAQEVRRLWPFVPVLAARARHAQDVEGVALPRGGLVVLDVHGTDHDPRHWADPERFDPQRFLDGRPDADALVPQGGGEVATGHRCPGESVVLSLLTVAVQELAAADWTLPAQDLSVDPRRMPVLPRSGVLLQAG